MLLRFFTIGTVAHIRIPSSLDECYKEAYLPALRRYVSTFQPDKTLFIITGHRWVSDIADILKDFPTYSVVCQETDDRIHQIENITIITVPRGTTEIPEVEPDGYGDFTIVVNFGESLPTAFASIRFDCVIAATTSDIKLPEEVDRNTLVCSRHYPEGVRHGCMHLSTATSHWRVAAQMSDLDPRTPE